MLPRILTTAKMRGAVNVLYNPIKELQKIGCQVDIYATGNESERSGFKDLEFQTLQPSEDDYNNLVKKYDLVISGLEDANSSSSKFIKAANENGIPSIAVLDKNIDYQRRIRSVENIPTILTIMDESCKKTINEELPTELAAEVLGKVRVIGWTAFDDYARKIELFTEEDRAKILKKLRVKSDEVYVHFTQNTHPRTKSGENASLSSSEKKERFEYEIKVTEAVFQAAADLGLQLIVKPHPAEEAESFLLAKKYCFTFIESTACDTQDLMLAADSVTATASNCLTEACLLDRNTAGILPGVTDLTFSPATSNDAILYAKNWNLIDYTINFVTSPNPVVQEQLREKRKRFSVDGKASARLVDLVEELIL